MAVAAIAGVMAMTGEPVGDEPAEPRRAAAEPDTIGARGWQSDPSSGRTTGAATPASGLSLDDAEVLGREIERAVVADPGAASSSMGSADGDAVADTPADGAVGLVATEPVPATVDLDDPRALERPFPDPGPDAPPTADDLAERGAAALALITYDWQERLPSWSISFAPAEGGRRGLTFSAEQRIEIYVRDADTAWDIARVAAHELGHAVDLAHNSTGERRAWREQRSLDDDTLWWPVSGASDFATGAGDFAECFATWQVGSTSLSRVAGACSTADLELVAELS